MSTETDQIIRNNAFRALDQARQDRKEGKPLPPLDPFAQALCETGDAPANPHVLRNMIILGTVVAITVAGTIATTRIIRHKKEHVIPPTITEDPTLASDL